VGVQPRVMTSSLGLSEFVVANDGTLARRLVPAK
jgi:hypothetical protein